MINTVTPDAQAILMLASPLAAAKDEVKRFSLREWNELARQLAASELRRPAALLGKTADDIRTRIGVAAETAERITTLLSRGVQLSIELERLQTRGIWVLTRADAGYPRRLKDRLKERAPAALFGAGNPRVLDADAAMAIVGSREVDDAGVQWARMLAEHCAREFVAVVSGAARGVDRTAMLAALEAGGQALGVVAESLSQMLRNRELREYLTGDHLALVTASHPDARFTAGIAMERNKYIYALSNWAVVVASAAGEGGTWSGANENLKAGWTPLFVRTGDDVPPGNRRLIENGATAMDIGSVPVSGLRQWLDRRAEAAKQDAWPLFARGTSER